MMVGRLLSPPFLPAQHESGDEVLAAVGLSSMQELA